jgi:hypothetical protein
MGFSPGRTQAAPAKPSLGNTAVAATAAAATDTVFSSQAPHSTAPLCRGAFLSRSTLALVLSRAGRMWANDRMV